MGPPNLTLSKEDFKPLYPSSRCVSWSLLPPRAQPQQGLGWILQKSLDLGKTEQKKTPEVLVMAPEVANKCFP